MKGIQFLTDNKNVKKSLVIDLKTLFEDPESIEDFLDAIVAEHRSKEATKSWEQVKAERKSNSGDV